MGVCGVSAIHGYESEGTAHCSKGCARSGGRGKVAGHGKCREGWKRFDLKGWNRGSVYSVSECGSKTTVVSCYVKTDELGDVDGWGPGYKRGRRFQ